MSIISMADLIESGAHFGHRAARWNPKMKPFILGTRKRIHIIDLKETIKSIVRASELLKAISRKGELAVFVCTKKQLSIVVETQAKRCGMPYVNNRWLGGTFTNFDTIKKQLTKFLQYEKAEAEGTVVHTNKKEKSQFQRELQRLRNNLEGLRLMTKMPSVLIAVDQTRSKTSLDEAKRSGIPTICLIDTDGNPTDLTIPITTNDDAIRSVNLVLSKLADAVIEGKSEMIIKPLRTAEEKTEQPHKKMVHFVKKPTRDIKEEKPPMPKSGPAKK